jgi:hypothetical protein
MYADMEEQKDMLVKEIMDMKHGNKDEKRK